LIFLISIEFESGVINDLKKAIDRIAPQDIEVWRRKRLCTCARCPPGHFIAYTSDRW
jgi:hypothetical protein